MANSDEASDDNAYNDERKDNDEDKIYTDIFSRNIFEFQTSHRGSKFFPSFWV